MLEWQHEMNTLTVYASNNYAMKWLFQQPLKSRDDLTIAIISVFKLVWILFTVLSIFPHMVQEVMRIRFSWNFNLCEL